MPTLCIGRHKDLGTGLGPLSTSLPARPLARRWHGEASMWWRAAIHGQGWRKERGRAWCILTAAIHTEMEWARHLLLQTQPLLGELPDPSPPAAGSARTFHLLGLLKEILSGVFSKIESNVTGNYTLE